MKSTGSKIKKTKFEHQVARMAADFQIQAEMKATNDEFAETVSDGLNF
jgi:hypothetical protein